jgi:hypothetical protein
MEFYKNKAHNLEKVIVQMLKPKHLFDQRLKTQLVEMQHVHDKLSDEKRSLEALTKVRQISTR